MRGEPRGIWMLGILKACRQQHRAVLDRTVSEDAEALLETGAATKVGSVHYRKVGPCR